MRITVLGYKTRTLVLEPSLNSLLTVLHLPHTAMSSSVPLSPFSPLYYSREFINGTPPVRPAEAPKPFGVLKEVRRFTSSRGDVISRMDARKHERDSIGRPYPSNRQVGHSLSSKA